MSEIVNRANKKRKEKKCKKICILQSGKKFFCVCTEYAAVQIRCLVTGINTAHKMEFSIMDVFSKCAQTCIKIADLVTFTEEILNGKLHFLCGASFFNVYVRDWYIFKEVLVQCKCNSFYYFFSRF